LPRRIRIGLISTFWVCSVLAYWHWIWPLPGPLHWQAAGVRYQLLEPRALGFALLVPGLWLMLERSLADLPWQQRWLSTLFRSGFVALLALCIARPVREVDSSRICTTFLVVVSDSVSDASLVEAGRTIAEARTHARSGDTLRVISFARRPHLVELGPHGELPPLRQRKPPGKRAQQPP
jgi:hypothetical protein